jgi:hypothetical protein
VTTSGIFSIVPDGGTVPPLPVVLPTVASLSINFVEDTPTTPPTDPGGPNPVPVNAWTLIPPKPAGAPMSVRCGKHQRVVYDPTRSRHMIFGGDRLGSDHGQPAVEAYDTLTGLATVLSPPCVAAPLYMPSFPDNVGVAYDSNRDKVHMFRGFYTMTIQSDWINVVGTPSATSGQNVPFVAASAVFEAWHVGFPLKQVTAALGSTVIAQGTIVGYDSPTQVRLDITTPFANTNPISGNFWLLSGILRGFAATDCGRNTFAGDTGVLEVDCTYNCVTNRYEPRAWPVSPLGNGSDLTGFGWVVYDEQTDSIYGVRVSGGYKISILHLATNTWESVVFGNGMATGPAKTLVTSANSHRAQIAQVNRDLYFMSNRGSGQQALIRYNIPTKTFMAWAVPQTPSAYPAIDDGSEPQLVYDPVSNVLLHPNSFDLTGKITYLYIFDVAASAWLPTRPVPVVPTVVEEVRLGCCYWDPKTSSMGIMGRTVAGRAGYTNWHYRYAP